MFYKFKISIKKITTGDFVRIIEHYVSDKLSPLESGVSNMEFRFYGNDMMMNDR